MITFLHGPGANHTTIGLVLLLIGKVVSPLAAAAVGWVELRHFAFRANRSNFDRARRELERRGLDVEFQNHTIAQSIDFFDPDGYEVEITTYELGGRGGE